MGEGSFKYENCLLKHYVRLNGWLPACKRRLTGIRSRNTGKRQRKLRYFTFCAVGAIDVLMLDVAKVLTPSAGPGFHTVVFFDKTDERVLETQRSIPGAIGLPGDFTKIVLLDDPEEEQAVDSGNSWVPPEEDPNTETTRVRQRGLQTRHEFIRHFPFDVVNLDLEEFLFKPNDPMPGKVVNSLREVFRWQQRPLPNGQPIDGFSLLFTTRIGPANLSSEYLELLRNKLQENLERDRELSPIFVKRTRKKTVELLQNENFDLFFKLAMPKVLIAILLEGDWHVVPEHGIKIFEFERQYQGGSYTMLHIVMEVKRNVPPLQSRAPGTGSPQANEAHLRVCRKLFEEPPFVVSNEIIDDGNLSKSLQLIKSRRKKYYSDEVIQP